LRTPALGLQPDGPAQSNAALLPDIQIAPAGARLYLFRIGATYPTPFPGSQFPVDAFDARL
jgi:hypothetical protein